MALDINVSFQVLFKGAVSTEIFSSGTTWIKFCSALADLLSLAPSAVKVVYCFSVHPHSTLHTYLHNANDLIGLFDKVRIAQAKLKKNTSKEFLLS